MTANLNVKLNQFIFAGSIIGWSK